MTDSENAEQLGELAAENTQPQETPPPSRRGWLARLGLSGGRRDRTWTTERLISLSRAIDLAPEVAANYVLRGELYCELGNYARARDDFWRALQLCEPQLEQESWGLATQALQDRAVAGLREAERQLARTT